jgi:hypothetical protein
VVEEEEQVHLEQALVVQVVLVVVVHLHLHQVELVFLVKDLPVVPAVLVVEAAAVAPEVLDLLVLDPELVEMVGPVFKSQQHSKIQYLHQVTPQIHYHIKEVVD